MRQPKNDMVFPVSLSEIAFTLVFLLMLLLGFMILSERKDVDDAKAVAKYENGVLTLDLPKKAGTTSKRLAIH